MAYINIMNIPTTIPNNETYFTGWPKQDNYYAVPYSKLKEEARTSFLYITHDLATAYYISDYIAVMNRGTIVEFGNARAILSDPQHPYTQLLLGSVATMGKKWEEADIAMQDLEAVDFVAEGCRFRHRCPLAEQICTDVRPGATVMPDGREVYCHIVERELEKA